MNECKDKKKAMLLTDKENEIESQRPYKNKYSRYWLWKRKIIKKITFLNYISMKNSAMFHQ